MTNNLKAERTLTAEELQALFPNGVPVVAMKVLFPEKSGPLTTEEVRLILQALSTQQPMGEGRVKALKWVEYPNSLAPDYFGHAWEAETPFGRYVVEEASGSDSPVYETNFRYERLIAETDGLSEAKAAAEADYSKRVLSALHPNQESGE